MSIMYTIGSDIVYYLRPYVYRCVGMVTCAIMCQAGKGYSLWLCKSHEQEHPDVTANCDD